MSIEIRGTNTINKGAHLMLEAAVTALSDDFILSCAPIGSSFDVRARLGLRQTLHEFRSPRIASRVANGTPAFLKRRYGLVSDSDITGVLDASGFAYSDSFGKLRTKREVLFGEAWARRGVPKVLLPQALGPFDKPGMRTWYSRMFEQATLIYARDGISYEHVAALGFEDRLRKCPDFTIGLSGARIELPCSDAYAAIVPNWKMVTTGIVSRQAYSAHLNECLDAVSVAGLRPVVVIHERGDQVVLEMLRDRSDYLVFASDSPLELKTVIGGAEVTIGSRYHAIVSSLAQEVPAVVYGWSHKYQEVLKDFGVEDWIFKVGEHVEGSLATVLSDVEGRRQLGDRRVGLEADVARMWDETRSLLRRGAAGKTA